MSDRFVEPLDHPCCGPVGLFSEGAQFLFALDRNIEIQIDRITNFLGEGFAPNLCPARKLLLLIRIQMNECRGHVVRLHRAYTISMDVVAVRAARRPLGWAMVNLNVHQAGNG